MVTGSVMPLDMKRRILLALCVAAGIGLTLVMPGVQVHSADKEQRFPLLKVEQFARALASVSNQAAKRRVKLGTDSARDTPSTAANSAFVAAV